MTELQTIEGFQREFESIKDTLTNSEQIQVQNILFALRSAHNALLSNSLQSLENALFFIQQIESVP